jgi:hypothetical protein
MYEYASEERAFTEMRVAYAVTMSQGVSVEEVDCLEGYSRLRANSTLQIAPKRNFHRFPRPNPEPWTIPVRSYVAYWYMVRVRMCVYVAYSYILRIRHQGDSVEQGYCLKGYLLLRVEKRVTRTISYANTYNL